MSQPLLVENTIAINAPISKVWDALVNPEQTKKYMFGCEAISDWAPGSSLIWKGSYEGQEMVFVKGDVVNVEPGKFLAYTVIGTDGKIEDIPENYLTVTYELSEENGQTILHVSQGDFNKVGNGQSRYEDTYNNGDGWNPILIAIKKLVEEER